MLFAYLIVLLIAVSILALVVWNVLAWPVVTERALVRPGVVSVLIPARDEERNLAQCLDTVLRQGEIVKEILVYDDQSVDGTAQVISCYAKLDGRVRVLAAVQLPDGWCGKNFACARLAHEARGEWLLFLDADVRLSDGATARMLSETQERGLTLLSCWPGQTVIGFWERTLMPMLNFVVFTLFPAPLSLERMDASLGLAHGACLFVERESYAAFGGHEVVRDEIFEDTRLAQRWRADGRRGLCLDGRGIVNVRMYGSFREIWDGFQKNFFPGFRRESSFWTFLVFHLTVFLVPFIIIPFVMNDRAQACVLLLTIVCILLMRLLLAIKFGQAWWSVLLHPLSETILIVLGLTSCWRCKTGRGVEWKRRQYHTKSQESGVKSQES
jgi:glycosyltransferase involved in cell wall biosynthesis